MKKQYTKRSKVMIRTMIMLVFAATISISCSSDDSDMNGMNGGNEEILSEFSGSFVSDTHPTSGLATVNKEQTQLDLENFKTDDGPRLLLYLSTSVDSSDFVNLGDLKGVEGDFVYDIPAGTDLETHKFVVVWCVDFSVSFGHAELK